MAHIPTEVRRQQFIDAAIVVIARDGVDGATTRRIAEQAKAPLASLHYCFQTKENLLWAVFEQLTEIVLADIANADTSGKSLGTVAGHLLGDTIRRAVEQPDANRAQIEIWLWAERNDAAFANRLYDKFIEACKDFLRQAKTPLGEDQLETVTRVIVALVDGLCMQLITHGDNAMVLRELETAVEMLDGYLSRLVRRAA